MNRKREFVFLFIGFVFLFISAIGIYTHLDFTERDINTDYFNKINEGISPSVVRVGDRITITVPTNISSIHGEWGSSNVVFEPNLSDEQIAKGIKFTPIEGKDKRDWNRVWDWFPFTRIPYRDMWVLFEEVSLEAKIRIPNDPMLEGETIEGVLKMDVEYPAFVPPRYYEYLHTKIEEPITVHVFSEDEIESLPPTPSSWIFVLFVIIGFSGLIFVVYALDELFPYEPD